MLNKVAMTDDKAMQERHLKEVDRWFEDNVKVVDHRTKLPSYLST